MRYLVLRVAGDNDALHQKCLSDAVAKVNQRPTCRVDGAWVVNPDPPVQQKVVALVEELVA